MTEYRKLPILPNGEVYDELADDGDPSYEVYKQLTTISPPETPASDDQESGLEEEHSWDEVWLGHRG